MQIPSKIKASIMLIDGIPLTRAVINGEMRTFIIDSGAPSIVINANYLAHQVDSTSKEFEGVGGKGKQGLMDIDFFKWHGLEMENFTAPVIDLAHLETELKISFYGLIGFQELSHFSFCFDYQNEEILLWKDLDVADFAISDVIPFTLNKHIPLIDIQMGNENLVVGIDSGAAINLLDSGKQGSNTTLLKKDKLVGADKNVQEIQKGVSKEVKISNTIFNNMQVIWSNIDHLKAGFGELDGLFGYEFLKQRKMIVSYEHNSIFILK